LVLGIIAGLAIFALIVLLVSFGMRFGKTAIDTESTQPPQPDTPATDKNSDRLKIIINIEHSVPQGKECPQLKYKSGELVNPCLIDEHWKIRAYGRELTLTELQQLLVVVGNLDRETPGNPRTPSNWIAQIRAGYSAPWQLVAKVIETCGMAWIWKIEFGAEAMPVYLPKGNDLEGVTEEIRISLIHNPISPLAPTILLGTKEFKDWEKFNAHIKGLIPQLAGTRIPMTINPDSYVPFQMVLKAIKIIRKCSATVPIEFSAR